METCVSIDRKYNVYVNSIAINLSQLKIITTISFCHSHRFIKSQREVPVMSPVRFSLILICQFDDDDILKMG